VMIVTLDDVRGMVWSVRGFFFFFQAEAGIRDYKVTGVQTCALPISSGRAAAETMPCDWPSGGGGGGGTGAGAVAVGPVEPNSPTGSGDPSAAAGAVLVAILVSSTAARSEERRVGKAGRSGRAAVAAT